MHIGRRKKGLIFIEDMTQSLGLLPKVRGADYYVGSLRKWFAIPDGGFLIGENLPHTAQLPEKTVFVEKKRMAQHLKAEYLNESIGYFKNRVFAHQCRGGASVVWSRMIRFAECLNYLSAVFIEWMEKGSFYKGREMGEFCQSA